MTRQETPPQIITNDTVNLTLNSRDNHLRRSRLFNIKVHPKAYFVHGISQESKAETVGQEV